MIAMGTICEPMIRQARRLSAEEFCRLTQREASGLYRPRSEVLRMLALGEAWGACEPEGGPGTALTVLPLSADLSAPSALRAMMGWRAAGHGVLLMPPAGRPEGLPQALAAALGRAVRRSRGGPVWAVLECTPEAEALVPVYLEQGFVLRGIRPLNGLAPCWLFLFSPQASREKTVWVPLADWARLALWLSRGWGGVDSRPGGQGPELALCPA